MCYNHLSYIVINRKTNACNYEDFINIFHVRWIGYLLKVRVIKFSRANFQDSRRIM